MDEGELFSKHVDAESSIMHDRACWGAGYYSGVAAVDELRRVAAAIVGVWDEFGDSEMLLSTALEDWMETLRSITQ